MELKPHQKRALDNANQIFEESNKAIIVHPTGTGKTYIALKTIEDNKDKKVIFVAPSKAIMGQLKVTISKEYGVNPSEFKKVFPNLEITTYQKINGTAKKNPNYISSFDKDLVIFDEAHHTAATEWGKNAKDLMTSHPETKFLGLTATPERMDGIDVVKDVFDGNLADEMTLEEAVATGLLKMPDYVNAIYSYKPIIKELEERVNALKEVDPQRYIMLKKDMEEAKNALEKANGMPEIFAKHIKNKNGKFIVFCKDIKNLKEMEIVSKTNGWFDGVNGKVETLAIHSDKESKLNDKILKRFRDNPQAEKDTLRILFSVEKINEGIHTDDIAGVIMLRPTKSKIIFRQQLGRAMSISDKAEQTTVFDIVNNIDSFQDMHDFIEQVIAIRIKNNPDMSEEDIRKEAVKEFNITDETREISEILRKVAGDLESEWELNYQKSVNWRKEHNGKAPRGGVKNKEEIKIYKWERKQKLKYLRLYQDKEEKDIPDEYREKIAKLKELGLEYRPKEHKTVEEHFEEWKQWTLKHNVTPNSYSKDEEEKKIAKDIQSLLKKKKKQPDKYAEILKEYKELYAQYGRNKTTEKHFEEWKQWTLEHSATPSKCSKDDKENKIATGMISASQIMKKQPDKYAEILKEYGELYAKYGKNKATERHFEEWKQWTLEHSATPSSNSKDEREKKIAKDIRISLHRMKKQPNKYAEILKEYEELYTQCGRKKVKEKHFEEWKQWTLEHSVTPSKHSKDDKENKIATNMSYDILQTMKKQPDKYVEILKEYGELYAQYGRKKLKSLKDEKEKMLSEVRELKNNEEKAESLDLETKSAINKQISKPLDGQEGLGDV